MTMAQMFWTLMLIWILFGAFTYWPGSRFVAYGPGGNTLLLFILLLLLGWKSFGAPLHG